MKRTLMVFLGLAWLVGDILAAEIPGVFLHLDAPPPPAPAGPVLLDPAVPLKTLFQLSGGAWVLDGKIPSIAKVQSIDGKSELLLSSDSSTTAWYYLALPLEPFHRTVTVTYQIRTEGVKREKVKVMTVDQAANGDATDYQFDNAYVSLMVDKGWDRWVRSRSYSGTTDWFAETLTMDMSKQSVNPDSVLNLVFFLSKSGSLHIRDIVISYDSGLGIQGSPQAAGAIVDRLGSPSDYSFAQGGRQVAHGGDVLEGYQDAQSTKMTVRGRKEGRTFAIISSDRAKQIFVRQGGSVVRTLSRDTGFLLAVMLENSESSVDLVGVGFNPDSGHFNAWAEAYSVPRVPDAANQAKSILAAWQINEKKDWVVFVGVDGVVEELVRK